MLYEYIRVMEIMHIPLVGAVDRVICWTEDSIGAYFQKRVQSRDTCGSTVYIYVTFYNSCVCMYW